MEQIEKILEENNPRDLKALFSFDEEPDHLVILKFNLWARHLFPKYFSSEDAPHHAKADMWRMQAYSGEIRSFTDIEYRGAAKTARTKLFIAFCIANDLQHFRRYIKVLSEDMENSVQITTDIFNMLISPQVARIYPEIFAKTKYKREERMSSFTTSTGIKMVADIVGTGQRGKLQEEARPDLLWFEDFENRKSLMSAVITNKIWLNMEEARTGLAVNGSSIYTCNYISEQGNVHRLVKKGDDKDDIVLIVPIVDDNGVIAWNRYSKEDIDYMRRTDEDFEGERLCKPSASKDIYFDRDKLNKMRVMQHIKEIGGFKIFREFNPSHRYGSGHDVAGGVGLDSSASVFIDFSTIPAQVVGTYHSNEILPEAFGDACYAQGSRFGLPIQGIENNKYDQTVLKAKQLGANLYMTGGKAIKAGLQKPTTWGWSTNSLTKNRMFADLNEAIESGLIELNDKELILEAKAFTRNDLIERPQDVRLIPATRHFDLLTACAIAWQMMPFAKAKKKPDGYSGGRDRDEGNPAI